MVKVSYKTWIKSFPYYCTECGSFLHDNTKMCERCGKVQSKRKTTKKDYKLKFKKMKEL